MAGFDGTILALSAAAMRLRYWRAISRTARAAGDPALGRFVVPQSANQKYTWRKIFDRNPAFAPISDKIAVRDWLAARGHDIPAPAHLWTGTDPQTIPGHYLGQRCFLKASHGSGMNIDLGAATDMGEVRARAAEFLAKTYGRNRGEWFYYGLPHRLIVERSVAVPGQPLYDVKCYTFGARVIRVVVMAPVGGERQGLVYRDCGQGLTLLSRPPTVCRTMLAQTPPEAPLARAIALAGQLGAPFDMMRVDLLMAGEQVWFGELTVTAQGGFIGSGAGLDPESPESRAWDIRRAHFLTEARPRGWRRLYRDALLRRLEAAS